ncbi:DUF5719 family protein [Herbiconiux sp. P18]|uniref:DUF5719 family protein n=1 Tax=Herbiconiux liangxiaofengii TaxID=3342795 RepID=UPI0035BA8EEA
MADDSRPDRTTHDGTTHDGTTTSAAAPVDPEPAGRLDPDAAPARDAATTDRRAETGDPAATDAREPNQPELPPEGDLAPAAPASAEPPASDAAGAPASSAEPATSAAPRPKRLGVGARRTRRPARTPAAPRSGGRRAVATGARIATGVVVAALAASAVGAAFVLPLPSVTAAPASVTVEPAPAEQVRSCAGPLARLSDATGQDATAISGVGSPQVASAVSNPDVALVVNPLQSPDDRTFTESTAPQRVALPADAASGDVLFAAAQSQSVSDGDLVGFAAAACGEATSDSWLVAGATTVGRTSFVVLGNPGDVAAVVDLAVYGDQGAIDAPGANDIDVPARSTRILSLAGLAPELAAPVVHVTAEVGAVTAALQQSVVRGLAPGGVELAGSTAGPATEQVIAGIQVSGTSSIAEQLGTPDTSDLQSVLRMLVPGADPASVTIRVAEERTGGTSTEYQVGLTPGVATEFPLQDIPDGTYSVTISSDQPVVAGARTTSIVNGATDFAWYQPVETLDSPFFVAVPAGPGARLHLVNESDADAEVVLTAADGTANTVTFVPGARSVAVNPGSYTVTSSSPVGAVVTYAGAGALSSFAVARPGAEASPITVYP